MARTPQRGALFSGCQPRLGTVEKNSWCSQAGPENRAAVHPTFAATPPAGLFASSSMMLTLAGTRVRLRRSKCAPDEFVAALLPPHACVLELSRIIAPADCSRDQNCPRHNKSAGTYGRCEMATA